MTRIAISPTALTVGETFFFAEEAQTEYTVLALDFDGGSVRIDYDRAQPLAELLPGDAVWVMVTEHSAIVAYALAAKNARHDATVDAENILAMGFDGEAFDAETRADARETAVTVLSAALTDPGEDIAAEADEIMLWALRSVKRGNRTVPRLQADPTPDPAVDAAAVAYVENHNAECVRDGEPNATIVRHSLRGTRLVTRYVTPDDGVSEFNVTRVIIHEDGVGYHFHNLASCVPEAHAECFPAFDAVGA